MINVLFAAFGPQGGASTQGTGGGSPMTLIFMIIAIFAVMYFLMIRPQQRQKRQHQDMLGQLGKGDKVVTSGGLHGTVAGIKDNSVIVKIADNVKVEVNRSAISQIVSSKSSKTTQTQTQAKKTEDKDEESGS
ncbi:MAG: preprotein translocase subunit YajC [Spirochaetes bacterium]|nr:preprotein translocase subunit YajC [Spirochaetota bacterium]